MAREILASGATVKLEEAALKYGGVYGKVAVIGGTATKPTARIAWLNGVPNGYLLEIRGEVSERPYTPRSVTPPETGLVSAIDISTSRLTAASCACLRAAGYSKIIVGLRYDNVPLTANNLAVAAGEGFDLDAYAYLYWGGNVVDRVMRSVALVSAYPVGRLWLDEEDNGHAYPGIPDQSEYPWPLIRSLILNAEEACDGFPFGHYSAAWWWPQSTNDWQELGDREWWTANYNGWADLDHWGTPFAGIQRPQIHQYEGTTDLCGLVVDLNVASVTR